MGLGAAEEPVEISSDEEDGDKMPAAGKRKSPECDFEWLDKALAKDDCDAIGEGWDDPASLQEFVDSLMVTYATEIVMRDKNIVGDAGGDDDDDDDCVILDGDPDNPVAVAKEEGPRRDSAEDELQIVAVKGELACRDFPHPRHLCAALPFSTTSHATHCSMCHCYVCDSPAPCALWGKGIARTDHCHATDKDAKWKKLRQSSKNKSQPMPDKRRNIQNSYHPSSQHSSNAIGSTGKFSVSNIVSKNQQVCPSFMAPRNIVGQRVSVPRAPAPMPRTTIPSFGAKSARVVPPPYTPSNGNHLQPSIPNYGQMQPARPNAFQTAQVPPGGVRAGTFRNHQPQLRLSAQIGAQGQQYRQTSNPQIAANTVVGTGVPLSRCTSVASQGTQNPHVPSADTRLKEALDSLARDLGVSDYNTNQPLSQQSASKAQSPNPSLLLAQPKVSHWVQMNPSSVHNSSNHASGGIVRSSGSIQIQQLLPIEFSDQSNTK